MIKVSGKIWLYRLLKACSILVFLVNFCSAGNPVQDTFVENVDLIELNHFYDEYGRLVFDQVIFYDWANHTPYCLNRQTEEGKKFYEDYGPRYYPRAWRLVKNPNQIPQRDWEIGGYSTFWQDGEQFRKINSKDIRETWTQYDPELYEREFLPKDNRKELLKLKKK